MKEKDNEKSGKQYANTTWVTITQKDGRAIMTTSEGVSFKFDHLSKSSAILAMLHQTLFTQWQAWQIIDEDIKIRLTIDVMD